MHCPTCGKATTTNEKFCRSCGMNLEAVTQLVVAHSSTDEVRIQKTETEKVLLARMMKWMVWAFVVLGLGVVLLLLNKSFFFNHLVSFAASCLLLSGTGMATYGVLTALRDGVSLPGTSLKSGQLPPAETTKTLPPQRTPEPLPSVTERTTKLIAPRDVRKTGE